MDYTRFCPVIRMIKVYNGSVFENTAPLEFEIDNMSAEDRHSTLNSLQNRINSLENAIRTTSTLLQGDWSNDGVLWDAMRKYKEELVKLQYTKKKIINSTYA